MPQQDDWPDFFPEGVPPDKALPAHGGAFRLVKNIPPSDSDFLSTFEEYPTRAVNNDTIGMVFGVSFHRNLECSVRTRKRYKPLRDRYIVVGTLKKEHGVCLATPTNCGPSHLTVWRWKRSQIHSDFTVNAEEI